MPNKDGSILSIGSSGSILSIGSSGSILSIGSAGSILSIGSAGSIVSIGSVFSAASVLSVASAASAGSILSALSRWSVRAWRGKPGTRQVTLGPAVCSALLPGNRPQWWWPLHSGPLARHSASQALSRRRSSTRRTSVLDASSTSPDIRQVAMTAMETSPAISR